MLSRSQRPDLDTDQPTEGRERTPGKSNLAAARYGVSGGNAGGLPNYDLIQSAFGKHDVSGVRAHVGTPNAAAATAALEAEAFAFGDQVAFASATPSLHTVAHEAAHVVQQQAGVACAGGAGSAGDVYERHADEVADAVVRGQSAEAILDRMAPGPASGGSPALQRKESTATAAPAAPAAAPVAIGKATTRRAITIRTGPGTQCPKVSTQPDWVDAGVSFSVFAISGSWLQVQYQAQTAWITGGSSFVDYQALPPPAQAPAAPATPAAPAEEPGVLDQIGSAITDGINALVDTVQGGLQAISDAVFGTGPAEPTPPEQDQLEQEPETDAAPENIDAVAGATHFCQTSWYGADGELLPDADVQTCKTVLTEHAILGDYEFGGPGDAYNKVLQQPAADRPGTVTTKRILENEQGQLVDKNGQLLPEGARPVYSDPKAENVPENVKSLPQIKFIPGEASCFRATAAMLAETGATAAGSTNGIQMILDSDQEAVLDENGKPVGTDGKAADKGERQLRDTKSTEEIETDSGEDHLAAIKANVALASAYMDAELQAGRAVMVGVSYTNRNGNADKVTDHWICIYQKSAGGYDYFDPGASEAKGKGTLQVNPDKGGILEGQNNGKTYALAQVRLNTNSLGDTGPGGKPWSELAAAARGELEKSADAPEPETGA